MKNKINDDANDMEDILNTHMELHRCTAEKCKKETDALNARQEQYIKDIAKVMKNISLKPEERDKRLKKLAEAFNASVQKRKEIDCKLKHCYAEMETFIRAKLKKISNTPNAPEIPKKIAAIYSQAFKKGKITRADVIKGNKMVLLGQMQTALNNAKPIMNNILDTKNCLQQNCGALKKKVEAHKTKFLAELQAIHNDKTLSEKEKLKKLEEVSIQYYDSPDRNKLLDCELGKCRPETEKMMRETVKMLKTIPNPPKILALTMKNLDKMLRTNTLTKRNIILNDLKFMKQLGYKMPF